MKKTKSLLLVAMVLAMSMFATFACFGKTIAASGPDVTGTVQAQKITKIDAEQSIIVNYTVGNAVSVSYIVPQSLSEHIDITCSEGELKCRFKKSININLSGRQVIVNVVAPNVGEFEASSAATINVAGAISPSKLEVEASSAASVIIAAANVKTAEIDANSAASVVIGSLSAKNVDIEASSSASVEVAGTMSRTEVDSSSSATVKISGTCEMLDADASSSATIDATAAQVSTGKLNATSGASITASPATVTPYKITKSSGASITLR